uniref:Zgc:136439 n=1 Tax=Seriola dumerili TaxID=41447 RepID=A0A3B4TVG3_SERDU
MKAVILAAGYGTRLQRDVVADSSGRFAHLAGTAKPLLPVGHCALISHWVHALTASDAVDSIYVVTNALYHAAFEEWAAGFTDVKILSDQTRNNDRLGAVACLQLAVKHFKIADHVVVIGGDTLFKEDFSLSKVKERFSDLRAKHEDSCLVLSYQCKDEETHKYGILEVDNDLCVLCMKEKPLPSETKSRRACPCFYMFSKKSLPLLDTFLEEKKVNLIIKSRTFDIRVKRANCLFLISLLKPVYVHQISGRFDVGNLPSYIECDLYFREKLQDVKSYMV